MSFVLHSTALPFRIFVFKRTDDPGIRTIPIEFGISAGNSAAVVVRLLSDNGIQRLGELDPRNAPRRIEGVAVELHKSAL